MKEWYLRTVLGHCEDEVVNGDAGGQLEEPAVWVAYHQRSEGERVRKGFI